MIVVDNSMCPVRASVSEIAGRKGLNDATWILRRLVAIRGRHKYS